MAKQTQEKVQRINRATAANQVVAGLGAGKTTLTSLAEKADTLVVEHGGTSNIRAAHHSVKRALETAEALGSVRLTRPTDVLVEKAK